jgi:diguanylate cyclase (GGDEF)-like protein
MRLISGLLMTQGELLLKLGQHEEALAALERAQSIAGDSTFTIDDALARALAKTHEAMGNHQTAAHFWQRAFEASTARIEADREALSEELAVRYEVAKRDKDIELLNVRNELQNLELESRSRQLFAVGGALLSALLIMSALWRGYQSKQTLESELKARNAKLEDALATIQKLASTDSLTGLLNRRAFHDIARQSLEYKRRTDKPISLTLGDVDGFKQINDQYGHATGDEILVEIATRLKDTLRTSDVVVRWGGEEFLCFFPDTDEAQALDIVNKLRAAISAHDLTTSKGAFRVTITFGVAGVEFDVQDAIRRADVALYEGKNQGGNTVVPATQIHDKN